MKLKLILWFMLLTVSAFSQTPPDVFLEADPATNSAPPIEDLPPDEPPYTKSPDELEAQQLLEEEPPKQEELSEKKTINLPPQPAQETAAKPSEPNKKKIAHPDAKKGLYLIDQNTGRYYYKTTKLSQKNQSTSIRFGSITAPNISMQTGGNTYLFEDIYGDSTLPYLLLDYEWQPLRAFGKLGVILGLGFFTASGNGRFVDPSIQSGESAKEGFTFIGLPLSVGGIYRLEFSDTQWLAPFISAGLSYYVLGELRDDGKAPKVLGTPAAYGGGGILFNITTWSKDIDFTLDREYGINNMWLAAEFRTIQSLNEELDISSDLVNFGIAVDY